MWRQNCHCARAFLFWQRCSLPGGIKIGEYMKKGFSLAAVLAAFGIALAMFACSNGSNGMPPVPPPAPKTYSVNISASENGTVTAAPTSATAGTEITLTTTPAYDYALSTLTVTTIDGTSVTLNGRGNARTFKMPAQNVNVTAAFVVPVREEYKENGSVTLDGKTFTLATFGLWPQTIKAASVSVDTSVAEVHCDFTYCKGSDGAWYVEQAENARASEYKYSDGSSVGQGGTSKKWFKVEPIKWRVLTDNYGGKKLLLAESVLASGVPYCSDSGSRTIGGATVYANNYKYSTIRAWLNGKYEADDTQAATYDGKGFLQSAFTSAQASAMPDTTFDNSLVTTLPDNYDSLDDVKKKTWNNGVNQYASDSPMGDKIFLLSEKDVSTSGYGFGAYYDTGKSNRVRAPTDFAKATGALDMYANSYWWLRSPFCNIESNALRVKDDGDAGRNYDVRATDGGVVPALCLPNN